MNIEIKKFKEDISDFDYNSDCDMNCLFYVQV